MSAGVSPASAIAARHASTRELERVAAEAAADVGLPDAADDGAALEDLGGVDGHVSAATVLTASAAGSSAGSNMGSQTFSSAWCSNSTVTGMPIVHVVDRAVHDVGREAHAVLLLDPDDRDDERQLGHRASTAGG